MTPASEMMAKSSSPRRSRRGVRARAIGGETRGARGSGLGARADLPAPRFPDPEPLLCYGVMPRSPDRVIIRNARQHNLKGITVERSEEHTSELQSRLHLVCRLLLEKKNKYLTHTF